MSVGRRGRTHRAVGVLGGLLLFPLARHLLGMLPWRPGVFATDFSPCPGLVLLVAGALPLLGAAAGYMSQRRVISSPLGVTRRAAPRAPRMWRVVPLIVGVVMLVVLLGFPSLAASGSAAGYVLLLGGAGLTVIGLVLATPLVGFLAANLLLRCQRLPIPGQLAARRIQADPTSTARIATGVTTLTLQAHRVAPRRPARGPNRRPSARRQQPQLASPRRPARAGAPSPSRWTRPAGRVVGDPSGRPLGGSKGAAGPLVGLGRTEAATADSVRRVGWLALIGHGPDG